MKLKMSNFILSAIEIIHKELESRGIKFRPKYYISDEWGCPNLVPIIGVPYSYCYPIFKIFEEDNIVIDHFPVLKIIRHEVGHTINYAYKLYKKKIWESTFGNFNKSYQIDESSIDLFSKDFVRHLPDFKYSYAQIHPDEDFAETFAVWLTYEIDNWNRQYVGKALIKLWVMNDLMAQIKDKPPVVTNGSRHKKYSAIVLKN